MIKNYSNFLFESDEIIGGKTIFVSFLKAITALGRKNMNKIDNKDYLFIFKSDLIDVDQLKSIFYRFKSLTMFVKIIEKFSNCCLYYGIKSNLSFEYGFSTVDKYLPIGQFKLTKSNLNWLKVLPSPSTDVLKRNIISLDINDVVLFSKINSSISTFDLKFEKFTGPNIKGDVITYGYYGIGKWNSSNLDESEHTTLKSSFKNWISKYKWSERILVSVNYNSYWVYFNIKIKK